MYSYVLKGVVFVLKKLAVLALTLLLSLTMCGCDFFTTDIAELLSPPALSDDLKLISEAISKSVGKEYQFAYPQLGEYHYSNVHLHQRRNQYNP